MTDSLTLLKLVDVTFAKAPLKKDFLLYTKTPISSISLNFDFFIVAFELSFTATPTIDLDTSIPSIVAKDASPTDTDLSLTFVK